jgi:hypothetical protein
MKTEWALVGTQNEQADPIPIAVRVPPGPRRQNDTHVSASITSTIAPATQINSWPSDRAHGLVEVET